MSILKNLLDVAYQADCLHYVNECQKAVKEAEEFLRTIETVASANNVLLIEIPERDWNPQDAVLFVGSLQLSGPHIVLLSGRGPVWLYGMLVHAAHASKAVATMDPRLGGYVIVESHCSEYVAGQMFNKN